MNGNCGESWSLASCKMMAHRRKCFNLWIFIYFYFYHDVSVGSVLGIQFILVFGNGLCYHFLVEMLTIAREHQGATVSYLLYWKNRYKNETIFPKLLVGKWLNRILKLKLKNQVIFVFSNYEILPRLLIL